MNPFKRRYALTAGQKQMQDGYKQISNITVYNHHLCASGGCIIPDRNCCKPTTAVNDHIGESVGTMPTSPFADEHETCIRNTHEENHGGHCQQKKKQKTSPYDTIHHTWLMGPLPSPSESFSQNLLSPHKKNKTPQQKKKRLYNGRPGSPILVIVMMP